MDLGIVAFLRKFWVLAPIRINRTEFLFRCLWWNVLFPIASTLTAMGVYLFLVFNDFFVLGITGLFTCAAGLAIIGLIAFWSSIISRLRDFNCSPWTALVMLVPIINLLFYIALFLIPGSDSGGDNLQGQPA